MRSKKDTTFWGSLLLFQVAFGLAVFLVTRAVYMPDDTEAVAKTADVSAAASQQDDLLDAVSNPFFGANPAGFEELNDPVEISRLADEFFAAKDYRKAADMYERLLRFNPHSVEIYNNLGLTLHYVGRSGEALEWLNKGIEIDAENQRIWLTLGFVASTTGDTDTARTALDRAISTGSDESIRQSARKMLEGLP